MKKFWSSGRHPECPQNPENLENPANYQKRLPSWVHQVLQLFCDCVCDCLTKLKQRSDFWAPKVLFLLREPCDFLATKSRVRLFLRFFWGRKRPHCGLAGDGDVCDRRSRRFVIAAIFGALSSREESGTTPYRQKVQQKFGSRLNTVLESMVSNTGISELFGPHWVSRKERSEFLSACYNVCADANSLSFRRTHRVCRRTPWEFSLPKQHSRNSIPPVSQKFEKSPKRLTSTIVMTFWMYVVWGSQTPFVRWVFETSGRFRGFGALKMVGEMSILALHIPGDTTQFFPLTILLQDLRGKPSPLLGPVLGRTDFALIFIYFLAASFLLLCGGQKLPEKYSREEPMQDPSKIAREKSPTHVCRLSRATIGSKGEREWVRERERERER